MSNSSYVSNMDDQITSDVIKHVNANANAIIDSAACICGLPLAKWRHTAGVWSDN